jgi:GTPase Era involved in 16S rRNA processing
MTYTYPENSSEKIKGIFVDAKGRTITFETPGVFNEDGTCNKAGCDTAVSKMIEVFNSINARKG